MGTLRIIGGQWRGRKIQFAEKPGVRPTSDRVRETLFNWLAPHIRGARCLDLFAGSGALGFEALSRGADFVEMVDQSADVIKTLQKNIALIGIENIKVSKKRVPNQLSKPDQAFDIVFLDPPFRQDMIKPCCDWLESNHALADDALIYIEVEKELETLPIPDNWEILKQKIAGQVRYCLIRCN